MKSPVKIGAVLAVLFIVVKMIFHFIDPTAQSVKPMIFTNIFLLMAAIFTALYVIKRDEPMDSNALLDIKNGLRAGMPYAVIVAGFLYVYYTNINPEYNQRQIEIAHQEIDAQLDNPDTFKKIRSSNPDFEVKTKDEIRKTLQKNPESVYTGGFTATLALLGMLLLSTLYSILISIAFRTIFKPR